MRSEIDRARASEFRGRAAGGPPNGNSGPDGGVVAGAALPASEPMMGHYDLTVVRAREEWTQVRWSLFVFPDITDVAPTDDSNVVRIFYEGVRAYPNVWRVELLQAGFDVPALDLSGSSGPPGAAAGVAAPPRGSLPFPADPDPRRPSRLPRPQLRPGRRAEGAASHAGCRAASG
jgi:hypothetical protein